MTTENDLTTRRNALKLAGSSLLATGVIGTSSAEKQYYVIDLALTHSVESSPGMGSYLFREYDLPKVYRIKNRKISLTKFAAGLPNEDGLINLNGLKPLPDSEYGQTFGGSIITRLVESNLRPTRILPVVNGYKPPKLNVSLSSSGVGISGPTTNAVVSEGSEKMFELPTQKVVTKARSITGEKVDAPSIPEHKRAVQTREWSTTATVQPKVRLRNYGYMAIE